MAGVQAVAGPAMMAAAPVQAAPASAMSAAGSAASADSAASSPGSSCSNLPGGQFVAFSSSAAGRSSQPDMLMALVLALLLSKADNQRQQNDSLRLLAQLAILASLAPQLQQGASLVSHQLTSLGTASQAYQTAGTVAAAGTFNAMA